MDKKLLTDWVGIKNRDESALLHKYLKTKDIALLLRVYEPYMYLVYGLAYKLIQEPKQSQEIVYAIFKQLIKDVPEQEIRVFSTWLYQYTREFCFHWRSKARSRSDEIIALGGDQRTPITFYEKDDQSFEEEISKLENEIINLKNEQQRCHELFFKDQKCFQEIADITGWDVQLIKRHIRNAKKSINVYQD